MIRAMPNIIKNHPDVVYIIPGETHPPVKGIDGDAYPLSLHQEVRKNKVDDYVIFHNHFVSLETLVRYLQTATIYVTPYSDKDQITSGTFAYALGCGRSLRHVTEGLFLINFLGKLGYALSCLEK